MRCEDGPVVTLHDGRVVCSYCPDWKQECLAREILAMPFADRKVRLDGMEKAHGKSVVDGLKEVIRGVYGKA